MDISPANICITIVVCQWGLSDWEGAAVGTVTFGLALWVTAGWAVRVGAVEGVEQEAELLDVIGEGFGPSIPMCSTTSYPLASL